MDPHLATFRFDVSPPLGHPLCGGWIKPASGYDDALEGIGLVLLGAGEPIVLCALDWTGLMNEAHVEWRRRLAEAARTTPERVAVHCVHQHNAPFVCLGAEKHVAEQGDLPHIVDRDFYRRTLDQAVRALSEGIKRTRRITAVAAGRAPVVQVASNRRFLGPDGRVRHWRASASRDPRLMQLPEGLIDPWLRTVAFFDRESKVASCHYYATHPMSYYGDGRVSSDFVGLARKRRAKDEPSCTHLYFTGCAGNVAAGKYNDGSPAARTALTERIYAAIVASEQSLRPENIGAITWRAADILPPPRASLKKEDLRHQIANRQAASVAQRSRPAYSLAWLERLERSVPITVSALSVNDVSVIHLPAESFVEYQIRAANLRPERLVACAAYGDGGPWYIPIAEAYPQGGYEVEVAFCDPGVDDLLSRSLRHLLGA